MEIDNEQRTEQRLSYRWPVHFIKDDQEKTIPGQIVNVCSQAIAFLCHADENRPHLGQLLTTSFGVPHFNHNNSFDTVLFNRTGRVCRLDELSSQVNRVVVQFTEPLFFKPGNQNINDFEIQKRLENKALSIIKAEEEAKVYNEALNRAEERIRFYTEMSVKAEEKAKAAIQAEARAEARAKSEIKLRAKAEKKAEVEAEKRSRIEAEAQKKAQSYAEEISKIKAETAQTLAQIKAETAETIAKIEEELKIKGNVEIKITDKLPIKEIVLKKVDKFVTDRNKIF
jgi:hypothetical protein